MCAGYIGGRMVKWLEEIIVTEGESDNFYHFHDNRVLPSHITEQMAKAEGEEDRSVMHCWSMTPPETHSTLPCCMTEHMANAQGVTKQQLCTVALLFEVHSSVIAHFGRRGTEWEVHFMVAFVILPC